MSPNADAMLDEAEIERLARRRTLAAGYREAARRALAFARRYRAEEGTPGGTREVACIAQAQAWRRTVREIHAGSFVHGAEPDLALARGPGLTRVREIEDRDLGSSGKKTG